jgi:hypothetical protein
MRNAAFALALLVLAACGIDDVRTVVYYDFVQMEESAPDQHYQQFADVNGGVVDFGCFVVQERQTNCFDIAGNGEPNLHLGVVECECPCTEMEADPCDASRPMVRKGTIRGVVAMSAGPLVLGGVELPVAIDLADATHMIITVEQNADDSPRPSPNVLLEGDLERQGAVVNGVLDSPSTKPVAGRVTLVPATDEVLL